MARSTGTRSLRARTPLHTCGLAALGLLAALLPFELTQPLLSLGPVAVTNVELALYLVLLVWVVIWVRGPRSAWTGVHGAVAAWLAVVLLAALFAPTGRGDALKFALRTLGGGALFFASIDLVATRRQVAWIALTICAGAVLSAAAGVAEVWLPAVRGGLEAFKKQSSFAGGFLRASGTFQYANTAWMYWEAVLPLTLALGGVGCYECPVALQARARVAVVGGSSGGGLGAGGGVDREPGRLVGGRRPAGPLVYRRGPLLPSATRTSRGGLSGPDAVHGLVGGTEAGCWRCACWPATKPPGSAPSSPTRRRRWSSRPVPSRAFRSRCATPGCATGRVGATPPYT